MQVTITEVEFLSFHYMQVKFLLYEESVFFTVCLYPYFVTFEIVFSFYVYNYIKSVDFT